MAFKSPWRGVPVWGRIRERGMADPVPYWQKVLNMGPIAYWPLWEASGTTAECLVNPLQNGTYSSDVSGWPVGTGIGDGNTAPGFDGTNDYIDIMSATLGNAWNHAEGSVGGWARVNGAGVWTDGAFRSFIRANDVAPTQGAWLRKANVNNQVNSRRWANGAIDDANYTPFSSINWFHWFFTWSEANNEILVYVNGSEVASNLGINVSVAGDLFIAFIGSESAVPASPWHGWLAHPLVFDRIVLPGEIAELATV